MLSKFRFHIRHNVVGYTALFFALTGVAYAAGPLKPGDPAGGDLTGTYPNPSIAENAVDSGKVSDNSLTDSDIATANKDGTAATPSLRTLGTGAKQAAAGNDPRFSHDASASSALWSPGDAQQRIEIATTHITTPTSGKLVVNGKDMRAGVDCSSSGGCSVTWGLYVDGQPIPGSGQALFASAGETERLPVVVYGVMDGVAAGTHTVELAVVEQGPVSTIHYGADEQVEAIGVGG